MNGAGSADSDGTIASYAWTFGDGGTATGATANHTYAAAGTYPVTLTVTDNGGLTGSSTQNVTVTAAAVTTLADDLFGRTVTGGFGTAAPTGGAWTNSDTAANLGVSPGAGTLTVAAGAKAGAYLGSVSANRVDILTSVTLNKLPVAGNGYYFYVVARRVSATEQYFVRGPHSRHRGDQAVGVEVRRLGQRGHPRH